MRAHLAGMKPADTASTPVPVSVPLLLLVVHEDGTLTATHDGHPVPPPAGAEAWRRSLFGQIVELVTNDRAVPVRVEVRESDGTTFTDILPATARTKPAPEPAARPAGGRRKRPADPVLIDAGDGFIAGEDIAIGLVTGYTDASHDGHARALLDPARIAAAGAVEVVLVGRISGTIAIRGLS